MEEGETSGQQKKQDKQEQDEQEQDEQEQDEQEQEQEQQEDEQEEQEEGQQWWWQQQLLPARSNLRRNERRSLGDGAAGCDGVERGMERIPVKRKLKDINEHLLCVLCSGYMIDPTAAIECLHTFCRKCIVGFMESSKTCPRCDALFHLTNPLLGIRSDRTLQTIIYKLVPGLYEEEIKRRCTAANMAISEGKDSGTVERIMENIQDATKGITIYTGEEKFSLSVHLDGSAPTVDLTKSKRHSVYLTRKKRLALKSPKIDRVYFLCPSAFTIGQLKKLLYLKFTIDLDFPIDILHGNDRLRDEYSLVDVAYITSWQNVTPMELTCQVLPKYSTMTSRKASTETCAKNRIDTANVKQRNLGKRTTHDLAMRIFKSKKTKPVECSRGFGEGTSKGPEDWSKRISDKREQPTGTKNKETSCRNFVKTNTKSSEKLSEVRELKSEEKNTFKSTLQKELYEKKLEGHKKKSVEKSANIAEKNIESSKMQSSDKSSASSISKKTEVTSLKKPEVTPKKAELKSVHSKMDVKINPKKTEVTSAQTKNSVVTLSAQKKSEMTSKKQEITIKQQETKIPSLTAIRKRKFVYTDDEEEDDDDDEDRFVFEKRQKKKADSKEEMRNLSHATVLINEILSEQSKCSSALPPPSSTGHPADSALSPGQSSTVSESPTDDGVDSLSANLAKNQRSGTSSVSMTSSSAIERNVFEKFSSIMGSANENVVSSSTSSQVSEEDDDAIGSDVTGSKTSVETQTSDITPPPPAIREMKAASSGKIQKSTASSGESIAEGRGDKGQAKKTCSVSLAAVGNKGQFQKPTSGGVDPGVMSATPRSANASAVGIQSPSRPASSSSAASSSVPAAGSTHRSPILTTDIKPTRDLKRNTASVQLIPSSSPPAASAASVATSSADASATAAAAARGSSLKKTSVISPKQKTIAVASNNIPSLGPEIARSSNKACKDTSPARSAPANASATLVKTTSTGGARPTSAVGVGNASGSLLGTTGGSIQRLQEAKRDNYIRRPTVVDDPSRIARNAAAAAATAPAAGRTSGPAAAPSKRSEACISLSRSAVAGTICLPISLPSAAIPSERADSSIVGHVRAEVATTEARRREAGSFWNSTKEIASTKNIETDKLSPEHNNNPKTSRNRESDDLPLRHMAAGTVVKSGSVTGRNDKATTSKADDKSASSNPPSKARLFKPYQMDSRPKSPAPKSAFPTSGLSNPFPSHSELSSQFHTSGGINFPYASTSSSSRNPEVETRVKVNSQEAINLSHSPSESAEREETNNNVRLKSAVHCGFPCLIKVPNFKPSDRNISPARSTERTSSSSSHRKDIKGVLEEKTSPAASTSHTTASIPHPSSIPSSLFPPASASSFASSSPAIHRLPVLKISPYRRSSLDRPPQASSSSLQVQDQTRDLQTTKSDRVRNLMQYSIPAVSKSPSPVRASTSATCASPGNMPCKDAGKTDIPSKPSSSLSLENQTHTKATSRAHEGSVSSVSGRGKQASPVLLGRGVDCTKTASEVFYTCAEADSGSSPSKRATGSRSSSTSSMGSRTDSSSRLDESSDFGLTKKLVIDLDRLSPPPPFQTSPEKSPSGGIPADKVVSPLRDSPTPPGKKRLVYSIRKTEEQYRCTRSRSFPETNNSSTSPTFSSSTSPTYSSSTTAESVDAAEGLLPPNAKRIKFLGKDFTFTRTLDNSKCSRPPRRRRSTATCGSSQQASPTSVHLHPVVVNEPELLPCREPVEKISNPALPPTAILQVDEDLPATPSSIYEVDSTSGGVVSSLPCVEGTSSEVPEAADWNINSQLSIPYQPDTELDAPLELTKKVKSSVDDFPLELMNKDVPLELTTKEVKDRQKQLEYQKRMSTYPSTSKMFASCVLPTS